MKRSITTWLARLFAGLLCLGVSSVASAIIVSDTEFGVGPISDVDTFAKAVGTFDLGVTFSSISAVTLTLDACSLINQCSNTLGAGEFYKFDLGSDSFDIGIGNLDGDDGAIVSSLLTPSAALINDLLDGRVDFSVGSQTLPIFNFTANIDFADITLEVEGVTAAVPEPTILALLALGLAGISLTRRKMKA